MNGGTDAEQANSLAPIIGRGRCRRGCGRESGNRSHQRRRIDTGDCASGQLWPGAPFAKTKSEKGTAMTKNYWRHGDDYLVDKSGVRRTTYFLGPESNPRKTVVRRTARNGRQRSRFMAAIFGALAIRIYHRFHKNN
jgi:hypothetical protein